METWWCRSNPYFKTCATLSTTSTFTGTWSPKQSKTLNYIWRKMKDYPCSSLESERAELKCSFLRTVNIILRTKLWRIYLIFHTERRWDCFIYTDIPLYRCYKNYYCYTLKSTNSLRKITLWNSSYLTSTVNIIYSRRNLNKICAKKILIIANNVGYAQKSTLLQLIRVNCWDLTSTYSLSYPSPLQFPYANVCIAAE